MNDSDITDLSIALEEVKEAYVSKIVHLLISPDVPGVEIRNLIRTAPAGKVINRLKRKYYFSYLKRRLWRLIAPH